MMGWRGVVNTGLSRLTGYRLVRTDRPEHEPRDQVPAAKRSTRGRMPGHYDENARRIIRTVRPRTMTSREKLFALIVATRHVADHGIAGAFVECGVWRGGSMQAIALTLRERATTDRDLHLFDTFEGMPPPGPHDVRLRDERPASELLASRSQESTLWALASLDDVCAGMAESGYPPEQVHFHPGRVEETIPDQAPETIALLRLDTDWYESTKHELDHLFDRVPSGGVIVIDDYGYWQGARRAVDEFLTARKAPLALLPMGSGRIAIKP
jgi:hypothetical protein